MRFKIFFKLYLLFICFFILTQLYADVKSTTDTIDFYPDRTQPATARLGPGAQLGIGTTSPSANLHVMGNCIVSDTLTVGGASVGSANLFVQGTLGFSWTTLSDNATLADYSMIFADTASNNIILTLPYAGNVLGRMYTIKKANPLNFVRIYTTVGDVIDSSDLALLPVGSMGSLSVISSANAQWSVMSSIGSQLLNHFTITVDTTKAGSSSNTFVLPLDGTSTYNFFVAWGDGSSQSVTTNTDVTKVYSTSGTYRIKIYGTFPHIYFNNVGDKLKLISIDAWGYIDWGSMEKSFYGCTNLTITATDHGTTNTGAVTNFSYAWTGCSSLASFPLIDTSSGTNFTSAWRECSNLTSFPLLDTSSVTNFYSAWLTCSSLTSFPLINSSSGMNFSYTWNQCSSLTSFPLIDTSKATNFTSAWAYCSSLTSFPILDSSKVNNFSFAWNFCTGLTSFPTLDSSKVTNFTSAWKSCTGLNGYAFPPLDMHLMNNGTNTFANWAMSTAAYNTILNHLANGDGGSIPANANSSVTFSGGSSHYDSGPPDGVAAHDYLRDTKSWTITDGGTP